MAKKIKGAIFDMDGTMLNTEVLSSAGWVEAGKRLGFDITEEFTATYRGTNSAYVKSRYIDRFGPDVPYDEIREIRTDYMFEMMRKNGVPVKKGMRELLDYLEAHDIPRAVATSSKQDYSEFVLKNSNLYDRFQFTIYGSMVTNSKPHPEIFLKAADGIGVPIEECIIFEDSPHGITAGRRAGATVIAVPDITWLSDEIRAMADAVIEDLTMAPALIDRINEEAE